METEETFSTEQEEVELPDNIESSVYKSMALISIAYRLIQNSRYSQTDNELIIAGKNIIH